MFYSLLRLQKFLESLYQALVSLIRVLLRFRFRSDAKHLQVQGDELFILANGPSLREDLEEHRELLRTRKLLCVNQFVLSEAYQELKPSWYIFLDIGFFVDNTIPRVAEVRDRVIEAFITKTEWPVQIFVPAEARQQVC